MKLTPNYYQNRVCLNVLANSIDNAKAVYEAAENYMVVGVLSKNYPDIDSAAREMQQYAHALDNALSIGLGAGDPKQSAMVSELAGLLQPQHVNQVFTGAAHSRTRLGQNLTVVNALVAPTGKVGWVKISTGALSCTMPDAIVPVETAIALLRDMGASSIKFFPMNGLAHLAEFEYLAQACAQQQFDLEPTGGIDLDNFEVILTTALKAGVPKIIPHVYSSIIDSGTGNTQPEAVKMLLSLVKKIMG